jgi:aspartyl/asparaginyl beta-hydroxylase (cupin superfamily)
MDQVRAALGRRDFASARAILGQWPDAPPLLAAQVAQLSGDAEGEQAALARALAANPRHVGALLAMGDVKSRVGDDRAATSFFRAALNQAMVEPQPPELGPFLQRAQQWIARSSARFESHLRDALGDVSSLPRLSHAIDLLTGKTQLYLQQPSMFYFPGLPQRAFYEREEFDWLPQVEAATPAMQAELAERMKGGADFRPYVEARTDRPAPNNPLKDDPSWGAHYFWNNGEVVSEHAAAAPATMEALAAAPIPRIRDRSPMALWSLLKPGTHIQPHTGMLNTRLIVHIPLVTNADCALRVGPETRRWEPGKALIFDDSFEHEAWNRGTETRVILLFEIWRPEIGAAEREALTRLFETIDELQPGQAGNGF